MRWTVVNCTTGAYFSKESMPLICTFLLLQKHALNFFTSPPGFHLISITHVDSITFILGLFSTTFQASIPSNVAISIFQASQNWSANEPCIVSWQCELFSWLAAILAFKNSDGLIASSFTLSLYTQSFAARWMNFAGGLSIYFSTVGTFTSIIFSIMSPNFLCWDFTFFFDNWHSKF